MNAEFISPLQPIVEPSIAPQTAPVGSPATDTPGPSFGALVARGLDQVTQQLQVSKADMQGLATGDIDNLHQVMLRLEQSRLSFQLMVQVRNKLLESYQEVMRMQV